MQEIFNVNEPSERTTSVRLPLESISDVSLEEQTTVLARMTSSSSTDAALLPELTIEGLKETSSPRQVGAIAGARDYWADFASSSGNQGGVSGFLGEVFGTAMGYVVEGVQAAADASDYWAEVERNADSPLEAVLAGMASGILVPAAVLDRTGSALNDVFSVNPAQIEDGLQRGVLKEIYGSPEEAVQMVDWLDKQIPADGTAETADRRTALLVELASREAKRETADPVLQEEHAYSRLFALRTALNNPSMQPYFPARAQGRAFDPAIAAAEHFFETSHRVAKDSVDLYVPLVGRTEVPTDGYVSAPVWAAISTGYALAKHTGILGGSSAGEHQSSWEMAGVLRGLRINKDS